MIKIISINFSSVSYTNFKLFFSYFNKLQVFFFSLKQSSCHWCVRAVLGNQKTGTNFTYLPFSLTYDNTILLFLFFHITIFVIIIFFSIIISILRIAKYVIIIRIFIINQLIFFKKFLQTCLFIFFINPLIDSC